MNPAGPIRQQSVNHTEQLIGNVCLEIVGELMSLLEVGGGVGSLGVASVLRIAKFASVMGLKLDILVISHRHIFPISCCVCIGRARKEL